MPVAQRQQASTIALAVEDLRKTFLVPVIDTLSFQVRDGEFVCLLGPNGCGKTTLLRVIAGIEDADCGAIYLHGSKLELGQPGDHRVGYVFQEPRLLPWRTIAGNVALAVERVCQTKRQEALKTAHRYLKLVGLSGFENYFPNHLSGGMQQRASIARALAVQPELLLMDEPFSALDPENRRILQDELRRIWQETGVTILFVTHNVDEALRLATRLLVLRARPTRILLDVYPENIADHEELKRQVLDIFSEQVRIQQELSAVAV
mgnify:CR=1 FL=1